MRGVYRAVNTNIQAQSSSSGSSEEEFEWETNDNNRKKKEPKKLLFKRGAIRNHYNNNNNTHSHNRNIDDDLSETDDDEFDDNQQNTSNRNTMANDTNTKSNHNDVHLSSDNNKGSDTLYDDDDDDLDEKEEKISINNNRDSARDSSTDQAPSDWNKSRGTHRNSDIDNASDGLPIQLQRYPRYGGYNMNNGDNIDKNSIYLDYFVVKSTDTKCIIRLHGNNKISELYRLLHHGAFKRNAFISGPIINGTSKLNQIRNNVKIRKIFFDLYDKDDAQEIPKNCCLIYINNMLVYNTSFEDICDIMKHTKVKTLQFQKPDIRPSRIIRFKQTWNLLSKIIRHKILFTKWFEYLILFAIIANTFCLAMVNPLKPADDPIQLFVAQAEYFFFAVFLLEMIFKMIGLGLYGKFYDPWLRKREIKRKSNKKSRKCKKCMTSYKRCCSKCCSKLYTKCAERGLLGKNRKIQVKRAQIRTKSYSSYNNSAGYSQQPDLWELSLSKSNSIQSSLSVTSEFSFTSNTNSDHNMLNYVPPTNIASNIHIDDDKLGMSDFDPEHFYYGYFPSGWNILDFVIVVSSFLSLFQMGNMTSIRIIRILRPLRTVSRIRSLRVLINTVFSSLGQLSNVLFLMLFLFTILGIVGVQLFNGVLHQTCFNREETDIYMSIVNIPYGEYDQLTEDDWYNGMNNTVDYIPHIQIYDYCQKPYTSIGCKAGSESICLSIAPNAHSGLTSFDNIGFAILNEFIMITFDGWSHIMYMMQDAVSGYVWIYFFVVTFVCSFFALQLNLAVLVTQYAANNASAEKKKPKHKRSKAKRKQKKKKKLCAQPTLINSPSPLKSSDSTVSDKKGRHKLIRNNQQQNFNTNDKCVTPFDSNGYNQQMEFPVNGGRFDYGRNVNTENNDNDAKVEEEFDEEDEDYYCLEEDDEEDIEDNIDQQITFQSLCKDKQQNEGNDEAKDEDLPVSLVYVFVMYKDICLQR